MTTATHESPIPRFKWSWLWTKQRDLTWNLLPFWLGMVVVALLYATRSRGPTADNPDWTFFLGERQINIITVTLFLYGPVVDAPHLWATIARTYTDREEWASRRRLFLGSLAAFAIGPALVLLPYFGRALGVVPAGYEGVGWHAWIMVFGLYTIFHINKQHWGFVCLYKRKNADGDPVENRIDALFFNTAIWLPYVAMLSAPWFPDVEYFFMKTEVGTTTLGGLIHKACHVGFLTVCAGYIIFQVSQWRKGIVRNGPKLLYMVTVLSLYYLSFSLHPRIAAFWVIITGTGHCAQYHAVVWAYGQKKYAAGEEHKRTIPGRIFSNVAIYIGLGLLFGILTLQGPGAGIFKKLVAGGLKVSLFQGAFKWLSPEASVDLGIKVAAAFIGGVRLHHFYVDSKIWRVGKSAALAKNLNVEQLREAPRPAPLAAAPAHSAEAAQ